jgi:hypothetical protein
LLHIAMGYTGWPHQVDLPAKLVSAQYYEISAVPNGDLSPHR